MIQDALKVFVRDSNEIEGITRDPLTSEYEAHERFLSTISVNVATLNQFQAAVAPGKPLRTKSGMDVRVGGYIAPPGGPEIMKRLHLICCRANRKDDPWRIHVTFEKLHPYLDGNGRTGRVLWVWVMRELGHDPFAIPFLHRFYYQTLSHQ